nr:unnamed protein product [Callosobruchus chinensis]
MDSTKPAIGIFVDLAKAFDTVSHPELLQVLHGIGFRGTPCHLLKSYLEERRHSVCIDSHISIAKIPIIKFLRVRFLDLYCSLYILYINEVFGIDSEATIFGFGDDL